MRAIWITGPGGPGALQVRETADCEAGPGQVRIRVRAAGLNFADVMAAQGLYPDAPKPLQLMNHNRTVSGVNIGRLWGEIAILREEFQAVLALWDAGSIKPHINAVYPFAEVAAAHRRILQRQNVGKIVLTP